MRFLFKAVQDVRENKTVSPLHIEITPPSPGEILAYINRAKLYALSCTRNHTKESKTLKPGISLHAWESLGSSTDFNIFDPENFIEDFSDSAAIKDACIVRYNQQMQEHFQNLPVELSKASQSSSVTPTRVSIAEPKINHYESVDFLNRVSLRSTLDDSSNTQPHVEPSTARSSIKTIPSNSRKSTMHGVVTGPNIIHIDPVLEICEAPGSKMDDHGTIFPPDSNIVIDTDPEIKPLKVVAQELQFQPNSQAEDYQSSSSAIRQKRSKIYKSGIVNMSRHGSSIDPPLHRIPVSINSVQSHTRIPRPSSSKGNSERIQELNSAVDSHGVTAKLRSYNSVRGGNSSSNEQSWSFIPRGGSELINPENSLVDSESKQVLGAFLNPDTGKFVAPSYSASRAGSVNETRIRSSNSQNQASVRVSATKQNGGNNLSASVILPPSTVKKGRSSRGYGFELDIAGNMNENSSTAIKSVKGESVMKISYSQSFHKGVMHGDGFFDMKKKSQGKSRDGIPIDANTSSQFMIESNGNPILRIESTHSSYHNSNQNSRQFLHKNQIGKTYSKKTSLLSDMKVPVLRERRLSML